MKYEIYLDVLFLLDFYLNILLLELFQITFCKRIRQRKIIFLALLSSLAICLLVCIPVGTIILKTICLKLLSGILIVKIGFGMKERELYKGILLYYLLASLLAGTMELFLSTGNLWQLIISAVIAEAILITGIHLFRKLFHSDCFIYTYKLYCDEQYIEGTALWDSGNSLIDPISGAMVHIINEDYAKKVGICERKENFRLIPYHSIGEKHGMLEGYFADEMVIQKNQKKWIIKRPLIGIYKGTVCKSGDVSLILNTKLNQIMM